MDEASRALILVMSIAAAWTGFALVRARASRPAVPWLTGIMSVLVGMGLAAQVHWPSLLARFERDCEAVMQGEVWRLVTALFFQDGGLAGGVFNLALLLLIGINAERLWRGGRWLAIYMTGGLLSQTVALAWQPAGAGNSVACFALGGSCWAMALKCRTGGIERAGAIAGLSAAAVLLGLRDIHGVAAWVGAFAGWLLLRLSPPSEYRNA